MGILKVAIMKVAVMNTSHLKKLAQIGIALSAEKDINKLLEIIVDEARSLTGADGGTLYLVDKQKMQLRFEILQNDTMKMRMGGTTGAEITLPPVPLFNTGEPNHSNVSSYVALTEKIVNVPDLYEAEGFDFTGSRIYDDCTGYRSQSMLVIPMKNHEDGVIGVLQLLNARDLKSNKVVPFDPQSVDSIASLASQAAVALTNRQLFEDLVEANWRTEQAFLDTIQRLAIVSAYKDKDTALHIKRMSRYSAILAGGLCLSPKEVDIVLHASQMHDVGKIGIPDAILLKPAKLDAHEWDIMKQHTTMGGHMLSGSPSEFMQAGRLPYPTTRGGMGVGTQRDWREKISHFWGESARWLMSLMPSPANGPTGKLSPRRRPIGFSEKGGARSSTRAWWMCFSRDAMNLQRFRSLLLRTPQSKAPVTKSPEKLARINHKFSTAAPPPSSERSE